jgi:molybdenum cofactor cytidylyltransferase
MIFGEVATEEAGGTILAHSLHAGRVRIRKGTRLGRREIEALAGAGIAKVTVLRLEAGDVEENAAAHRLAEALCGPGLEPGRAFTGRANLLARAPGVVTIDKKRINRLNRIDEALTVATVRPHETVFGGDIAATVKVIPFAVAGAALDKAVAEARRGPALVLHRFRRAGAGLLQTELPGGKKGLTDKARKVTDERLAALGARVTSEERVHHDPDAVADGLLRLVEAGADPIIVYSASAVADRRDVVPAGVVAAGGRIIHFGMPVDPGNLSLVARIGRTHVIAAPGSARSPRLHGFDWVLRRVLAGLPVGRREITAMGVGGLLKEITARPQLRAGPDEPVARAPRVGAIILAAGRSSRMGAENKLLLEIGGKAMLRHAADAAIASRTVEVVAVTGHEAGRVGEVLEGLAIRLAHNPHYSEGLSTSLRVGVEALSRDIDGVVVMLGDMPGVGAAEIDRLIDAFAGSSGGGICVSTCEGKRGNPVLWPRRFFAELVSLKGDVGARHLIGEYGEEVIEVEQGPAAALDVDTPEAFSAMTGREAGAR